MRIPPIALVAGCFICLGAYTVPARAAPVTPPRLLVGAATLNKCASKVNYYCGTVTRPLDPAGKVPGTINIHYEWFPHTNATPSKGTILAMEGGPGYGSTGSRNAFLATFPGTRGDWDMLLVDARGTGQSGAIDCPATQADKLITQADVAACGATLGTRSDLYGSDMAADDIAAILNALKVSKVDVYGDSSGSFAAQVFAGRHPRMVRTIILDGAYAALSRDGWYGAGAPGMRNAFDLVCNRSPDCSGSSIKRISRVLAALRASPANAPEIMHGANSGPMTPADIAFLMNTAGSDRLVFAELDPAARAFLAGDTAPLTRLVNEAYVNQEGSAGAPASTYSMGMFVADSCSDNPTIFDRTLPPAQRQASYQAAVARKKQTDPDVFSPFTIDEWLATPLDWGQVPLCLNWPVPSASHPPGHPIPGGVLPDVPALVLTGDLDTVTPVGEGDQAAAEFQRVTRVIVPNGGHVVAQGDANYSGCLSGIVSEFIKSDGKVDIACAATAIAPVRLVPNFPTKLAGVTLHGVSGDTNEERLRIARAAVLTAADSYSRFSKRHTTSGRGLRGGTFNKAGTGITLTNTKWVTDLAVSGSVAPHTGTDVVTAKLNLSAGATGKLNVMWIPSGPQGTAAVIGAINGTKVDITMPAP